MKIGVFYDGVLNAEQTFYQKVDLHRFSFNNQKLKEFHIEKINVHKRNLDKVFEKHEDFDYICIHNKVELDVYKRIDDNYKDTPTFYSNDKEIAESLFKFFNYNLLSYTYYLVDKRTYSIDVFRSITNLELNIELEKVKYYPKYFINKEEAKSWVKELIQKEIQRHEHNIQSSKQKLKELYKLIE